MLITLNELHLANRICAEYGVDLDDLRMLANIEAMLKDLQPKPKGQENG